MKRLFSIRKNDQFYSAESGYDLWAETYDMEQDNLMLFYDEIILSKLLSETQLTGKVILDFGCGTGRNWPLFLKFEPEEIAGCDISVKMLEKLKSKYKSGKAFHTKDHKLPFLTDNYCDIIVSNLVIAHVESLEEMFAEWNRVIKNSGEIIITDFHPALLSRGGTRSFRHNNQSVSIENHIHTISGIEKQLSIFGFKTIHVIEKNIDDDVRHFYARHNALNVYERFKGIPFIYGIHLKR